MVDVTLKRSLSSPNAGLVAALVDQHSVAFDGEGVARLKVEPGEHSLVWIVRGQPGMSYTIEITAPPSLKFSHASTLDGATKDGGLHWFTA